MLVLTLFSSSTPAAVQTTVNITQDSAVSFWFWLNASGLLSLVQNLGSAKAKEQEKQRDRDQKVDRLEISPGEVTAELGERVRFAAVAYDVEGNSISGVKFKWSGESAEAGRKVRLSKDGEFQAVAPGTFTVVAQAAGKSAQVSVVVRPGAKPDPNAPRTGTREVSTRDLPDEKAGANEKTKPAERANATKNAVARNAKRSHASRPSSSAAATMMAANWDANNYWSADDPGNEVGNPPGRPADDGAGSGNFQFTAPIYSLQGRGTNISLNATYNSRLWNKANSQISYDNDKGWPGPGFNLGFGKLLGIGVYTGCMIVEADGTRHSYAGNISIYNWGTTGVMYTTDGSFIDYTYQTGTNGVMLWAEAKYPNGTRVSYGAYSQSGGGLFPTTIEDANGNLIYITYVGNAGPRIQTVTDTAGRVINFHYNGSNLLTAITAPGLSGGARTLVRLHYHQHTLAANPGFSGLTVAVTNYFPWVVDAIYYPATGTGYWLNDSDSYSSYGMLAKVVEQRNMGFSASSLTDMGTVTQGSTTRSETYNYPLTAGSLTDAPTYSTKVESWTRDGTNFDSATTSYEVYESESPRRTVITYPNGTKNRQLSTNAPGQWNDGLMIRDETYVTESQLLSVSRSFWEPGAYGSARPTRIEKTDERNQTTAVAFSYGSVYNQVTEQREYDYGGVNLLRAKRTTYENSATYTGSCNVYGCYGRHIFNLPLTVELYASDNTTRVSRTEYQYDGQTLSAAPGVVMHNQASNPNAEAEGFCYWDYDWNDPDCTGSCWDYGVCDGYCNQFWICPYDFATDTRGNITQITTYANAATPSGAVTETRRYDVTGNLVKKSSSCCEQTTVNYTIDTQFTYPQSQTRGSATDGFAQVTTSGTYDFSTGLPLSSTDPNGRQSSFTYNTNSLRKTSATTPTGARTDWAYDDNGLNTTSTIYLSAAEGGGVAAQNVKYVNGRKQVRQEKFLAPGSVWDIVDTVYESMGQVSQQTLPYRTGQTPQWTTTAYDALGRVTSVTAPDGSVTQSFYNEASRPSVASSSPGETVRLVDPWGRERWSRREARNLLVEIVEPDPNSTGSVASNGMVTNYSYNTQGKVTQIVQGSQTRSYKYDNLGRLTAQKLAESSATLNDAGTYVGSGTWGDVFTYDERSNITSHTDARGVKTVYTYNNDPLNRLQSTSWDTSGFGDSANPVLAAATVTYSYRTKSTGSQLLDVTQPVSRTTAGISTESFGYDTEGRISSKTLTMASRASYPFVTDYIYDSLSRAKDVRYPAEYGNGSAPRKVVHHDYAIAGRVSGLTFDGQTQASNLIYNAAAQMTALSAGTGTNQVNESYGYSAQTGLLESQTVTRNGSTLLNLAYDYAGANGKRTGQLVKTTNNLDSNKNRGYEYDAVGRLKRATGGQNVNWAQRYLYDRYGNRTFAFSHTADQYIRNFYLKALDRQPNSTELNSWLSTLQTAYAQGSSQFWTAMMNLGAAVFTSQEYINRNRSDHWYVYDLYQAYLWRDPDAGGWAHWESNTAAVGRNATRAGFDWSPEFETHVGGTSPYSPPGGATVPADGWGSLHYEVTNNRINDGGWGYDAAGNQTRVYTAAGWQRYQYDAANRLVKVKADDNVTVLATNTYGDSSERLVTEQAGVRTYFDFDGGAAIAEYTESGASTTPLWARSYVYLNGRLLSKLTPNGSGGELVEYHHPDRLGTRIVTNPSTGGSFEQVTLPFGTALPSESTGSTSRPFTSYERSATTGLDYALNRHYDSAQGRFTQVDPGGMRATSLGNPQTLNMYAYCTNDPVNRMDPDGLGLISFFKKLFNWIKKHWKVILVAVAVAVAVLLIPGAPALIGNFFQQGGTVIIGGGTATEGAGGIGTTLAIILGASFAAGIAAIGTFLQKVESFEDKRLREAKEELLRRLEKNKGDNDCARLFGGLKAAKKALEETKFVRGPTVNPEAIASTSGNVVTINPKNGFYDATDAHIIAVGTMADRQVVIGLNDLEFTTFVLLHELGHRTGTLRRDGMQSDPTGMAAILNNADIHKACFPEITGAGSFIPTPFPE